MIWLTSDWHFCHDREFIWGPRGFKSIEEMNDTILERHNKCVAPDDDVYVLGDLMLKDNELGSHYIASLKGRLHIIYGNHDTNNRRQIYAELSNVVEAAPAFELTYKGYHFFLCHYPTLTANLEKESLRQATINLYGHTHQKDNFYQDIPLMYHCGVDSHECWPVSINQAIEDIKAKMQECKEML